MVDAEPFSTTIEAHPTHLRDLRWRVSAWLRRAGIEGRVRDEVVLAAHEAVAGTIERSAKRVDVHAALEQASIIIVVEADAEWTAPETDQGDSRMDIIRDLASRVGFHAGPEKVRLELELRL